MTIYASFNDEEETTELSSNRCWSDFKAWVKSLPPGECLDLRHLCQYKWDQNLERIRDQIKESLTYHRPSDESVRVIASKLLQMLADNNDKRTLTII